MRIVIHNNNKEQNVYSCFVLANSLNGVQCGDYLPFLSLSLLLMPTSQVLTLTISCYGEVEIRL